MKEGKKRGKEEKNKKGQSRKIGWKEGRKEKTKR